MPALPCLFACTLLQTAPAAAAPPAPPVGEVVVEGRRGLTPEQRAQRVVEALTQTSPTDDLIVRRFYGPCLKVVGVEPQDVAVIDARLRAAAALVGLPEARTGCEPDVLVVVAEDVDAFVDRSRLRGWRGEGPGFVTTLRSRPDTGPRRVATFKVYVEVPAVAGGGASRIRSRVLDQYDRTVVVMRADWVATVPPSALGDYVAMLALTSADETSVSPEPSIVNLLVTRGADAPAGLTARDRAYLAAYYRAFPDTPSSVTLGQIARQMLKDGAAGPPQ